MELWCALDVFDEAMIVVCSLYVARLLSSAWPPENSSALYYTSPCLQHFNHLSSNGVVSSDQTER